MIQGIEGWLHVGAALTAMLSGAAVVLMKKGTPLHKKAGWIYTVSMLAVNASAFAIYRLFGSFGPFHVAAVVSLLSLFSGMAAVIVRRPAGSWLEVHRRSMGWSVTGLYAAFVSETGVRLFPMQLFWPVVVAATLLVTATGAWLIYRRPGTGTEV